MASGVGKAACSGSRDPSGGSPSAVTSPRTIETVSPHEQLVVQSVLMTSSQTVGERSIRPAPVVAHARSGSSAAIA